MRAAIEENSDMINAMKTNLEMMDAKLDNIKTTTASIKQVQDLKQTMGERLMSMGRELIG